ncbi:protein kinase [bacterium]|nr:protein kinase [bacterium]
MAKLYVERGPLRGKEVLLEEGKYYLMGRDPECVLRFRDSLVSRRHLSVRVDSGRVILRDLDSLNGTYVNGNPVTRSMSLRLGDQIEVGETIVSVLADDERAGEGGLVGQTLAGYEILERVGRGGMGTVYKARQVSLDRAVAFKVLSSGLARDEDFIKQFHEEVRAAAQLVHPNIVQAVDVGTVGDIRYFVMEYVPGGSIEDKLDREGRIAPDRAVPMLVDVARGLRYTESQSVIHRDIKPDNLMYAETGIVKIIDMGIARLLGKKRHLVQSDGVFGSPHFIAPEQAAGDRIDHRADLYSLGASAYRMLSGRTMFTGESQAEIMAKHVNEEPRPLKDVAPWVPTRLCDLIMMLVEKEPNDRYSSAEEVLEALESLSAGGAVVPRPAELRRVPKTREATRHTRYEKQRRNKLMLLGLIAGLILLVLLILVIPKG